MVATRRSLGGQHSPACSSPPAAAPAQLSRAQQAALKKLDIAGTDALKGDVKAAQAAREAVQTYHYRGAVYAADANTPSSWIENQPKRYLKRSRRSGSDVGDGGEGSIAVDEDEDDDEEEEGEETRRPAKKSRHSMPHQGRNHKSSPQTTTSSRGKARAVRGGRQSLPAKRKAAVIDDENDDNMNEFDFTVSGGQDDRVCLPRTPNWLPESDSARSDRLSHRVNPMPNSKSPIPKTKAMNKDIQRRKQEAARKNYQVRPLGDDEVMSEKELARTKLVKLARKQRQLNEKLIEWKMAKELLDIKKKEAGLKAATPNLPETPSEQPDYQQAVDLTHSGSSQQVDEDEIGEQWDREQSQTGAQNESHTEQEIPETSPAVQSEIPFIPNTTYHVFTRPGASRPRTPSSNAQSTLLTGANSLPHSSRNGYTPTMPPSTITDPNRPTSANPTITKNDKTQSPIHPIDVDFATLPPDGPLPSYSAGGDPMRWTIQRRTSLDFATGEEKAEYAIDIARLEGESKAAKSRRVKRERAVVEEWSKITGAGWVERDGRTG